MAKQGSRKPAGGRRRKDSFLDRLNPSEARTVLYRLLKAHPELAAEAETIVRTILTQVEFESVAEDVNAVMGLVDADSVYSLAGAGRWGYTDPGDAAWELLEKALEPFLEDMKRLLELGHTAERWR